MLSKQPKAVWAVAFACVIAFMGIGLVDPILPAISADLGATPAEAMLLFTSYLLITGLAMFATSYVSSRIGAKRTLMIGLALIVVFAALAGASNSVGAVIGFRAGWGLGNALFISTALATIVGSATGGVSRAIVLYEAALGLGIATGPLLGGALGAISWRGPFFGTAVLMAIGLIAITVLLTGTERPAQPTRISDTFRALRRPGLLALAVAALCYNFGFFILLAYSPFPLETAAKAAGIDTFGAHELGLIFCGWGVAVAVSSVFVAPLATRQLGRRRSLVIVLLLLAVVETVMALRIADLAVLVGCIVVAGLLLGLLNTVLTESAMEVTDLPRSVASSTYSGVRFLGGALAPAVAGVAAVRWGAPVPYWLGVGALIIAAGVVVGAWSLLRRIDEVRAESSAEHAAVLTAADA